MSTELLGKMNNELNENRICRFFNTVGGCRNNECKFLHILGIKPPCKYILTSGSCPFNENCHFSHSSPSSKNTQSPTQYEFTTKNYKENHIPCELSGTNNNSMEHVMVSVRPSSTDQSLFVKNQFGSATRKGCRSLCASPISDEWTANCPVVESTIQSHLVESVNLPDKIILKNDLESAQINITNSVDEVISDQLNLEKNCLKLILADDTKCDSVSLTVTDVVNRDSTQNKNCATPAHGFCTDNVTLPSTNVCSDYRCGSCKRPVIASGNESYYNLLKNHYLDCFLEKEPDHVKYVKFKAAIEPGYMYWCRHCVIIFEKPWSLFQHMADKVTAGAKLSRTEKRLHLDWLDDVAGLMAGHDLGLFAANKLRVDLRQLLTDQQALDEELESNTAFFSALIQLMTASLPFGGTNTSNSSSAAAAAAAVAAAAANAGLNSSAPLTNNTATGSPTTTSSTKLPAHSSVANLGRFASAFNRRSNVGQLADQSNMQSASLAAETLAAQRFVNEISNLSTIRSLSSINNSFSTGNPQAFANIATAVTALMNNPVALAAVAAALAGLSMQPNTQMGLNNNIGNNLSAHRTPSSHKFTVPTLNNAASSNQHRPINKFNSNRINKSILESQCLNNISNKTISASNVSGPNSSKMTERISHSTKSSAFNTQSLSHNSQSHHFSSQSAKQSLSQEINALNEPAKVNLPDVTLVGAAESAQVFTQSAISSMTPLTNTSIETVNGSLQTNTSKMSHCRSTESSPPSTSASAASTNLMKRIGHPLMMSNMSPAVSSDVQLEDYFLIGANFGYTREELLELLNQDIQPWDPNARTVLSILRGEYDHMLDKKPT